MNIVIGGAGDVGWHLANLLTNENHNITIIDQNEQLLQNAANHLDVLTIRGDISSLTALEKAQTKYADLFIGVTTYETTNLLASILAKNLGAKKTIARISKVEYLDENQANNFKNMGVDHLLSPRLLAAQEIERLLHRCSVTDVFEFEEGKISLIGFTVDNRSKLVNKSFSRLDRETPEFLVKTVCILRNGKTIIPNNDMVIQRSDHIYLVTNSQDFEKLNLYIDKTLKKVHKLMIIGDTALTLQTAQLLEDKFSISLICNDEEKCKEFLSVLDNVTIINGDVSDIEMLKEEGLEHMDAFLALTENSETNIITSLTAEQQGVYKTIAQVDNSAYTHISQEIGVDTLINKKLIAANDIFRYVRKGKIEAIASLHGVNAEVIEFEIHKNNRLTSKTLNQLDFQKSGAIVGGVIRDGNGIIPGGDFQFMIGDKAVVFVLSRALSKIESIFR